MTYKQLFALAKKKYGLKKVVWFNNKKGWYYACCKYRLGIIYINKFFWDERPKKRKSTLFHELGHIYCYKNGIYKSYHFGDKKLTKRDNQLIRRIGLRAERWVDRWAKKEMKKYFPKERYDESYIKKKNVDIYKKNYLSQFK